VLTSSSLADSPLPVDKILISQESLGRLVNDLRPGAYTSMTKVDFAALDSVHLKPLGVYGSQSELVRFLQSINAVSDEVYVPVLFEDILTIILLSVQCPSAPHLRRRTSASFKAASSFWSILAPPSPHRLRREGLCHLLATRDDLE
jgi:hypothetical protein